MRPRGREQRDQETATPPPASPPRPLKGNLSSMVVMPDSTAERAESGEIVKDEDSEIHHGRSRRYSDDSGLPTFHSDDPLRFRFIYV